MFNIKGLGDVEVNESRKKYGNNSITHYKKNSIFRLIIESLNDPIIKILLIALGVKILFLFNDSDVYETIGIIAAVIIASVISSLSEYGSEKAFEKLSQESLNEEAKVFRNGKLVKIKIDDVVVGDYIFLESGDKISADGTIIEGKLYTDESMMSGETKEQFKENKSSVYRGTIVTSGSGVMLVNKVGNQTFYGEIAKDIQATTPESPLKNRLRVLANFISKIGYICSFLVMFSYLFNVVVIKNNFNYLDILSMITNIREIVPHLLYALTLGVTIIVVAVPEGLPMMITLVLSSNMKRLLKNNVLVRKLVGIESSGSLNILFSDKTGTITKGKLKVTEFITYEGKSYKSVKEVGKLSEILELSLVYNNASIYSGNEIIGGNITDRAILEFARESDKSKYKIISNEEFDSKKKYSSVILNYNKESVFIKGAYEVIIKKCNSYYKTDGRKGLIDNNKNLIKKGDEYTSKGYRVLALAVSEDKIRYTFLGFLLIKDEVRKEAIEGIKMVTEAGIQTVMITGDNKLTALNVAKEVGLITGDKDLIITSEELNMMNDEEIKKIIPRLRVVARSLPEDKKRLVNLSQELGLVVGMTGDGVNDAPALKRADVGFAMGSGTEVAKEVSDIVILDDNFMSIAKTILFGRTIFKSIRKFIIFQLTVNLTTVFLSVIGPLIGITSPLAAIQMLWINMVMDTLAGIAYAYEPPIKEYMEEPPKKRDEKIMNSYMINEILFTGLYMSFMCMFFLKSGFIKSLYRIGNQDKYLMTAFFGLFIFMSVFNAFNARSYRLNIFSNVFRNKVFLSVIIFIVLVQLSLIYFGGSIFRTTGLTLFELNVTILIAFSVIPVDFIRKIILKKFNKKLGV